MIEILILNHIVSAMGDFVSYEKPENKAGKYITLERIGGSKSNHLRSSTFAFQSYEESLKLAAELNELVKIAVESLIELDEIISVNLNSDYNFTDTKTKEYRYQAVFDIKHY